jgi:hypothetical protein
VPYSAVPCSSELIPIVTIITTAIRRARWGVDSKPLIKAHTLARWRSQSSGFFVFVAAFAGSFSMSFCRNKF